MENQATMENNKKAIKPVLKRNNGYYKSVLTRRLEVSINHVGQNIKQTLENILKHDMEEKCCVEGYIKKGSTNILSYSSGVIKGELIEFEVVFECQIYFPVEGLVLECIAKNITKAGIRAELDEQPSPIVIFVSRDHHYDNVNFANIKENDTIHVRVIANRFELNDKYISVIGELMK